MATAPKKKRAVVSYENMLAKPELAELAAAFAAKYPKGFNDYLPDLMRYPKLDGTDFYAVTVEIPEAIRGVPYLVYAGRTLGMSELAIFWRIVVPTAGPGIASGTILTFARAMGEYGATSMLAGNIPGKTGTVSQRIAMVIQDGDYMTAGFWVIIVLIIAFIAVFTINMITGRHMKNIRKW